MPRGVPLRKRKLDTCLRDHTTERLPSPEARQFQAPAVQTHRLKFAAGEVLRVALLALRRALQLRLVHRWFGRGMHGWSTHVYAPEKAAPFQSSAVIS